MTDEELIARLRSMHWCVTTKANGVGVSDEAVAPEAADRIETLTKERDALEAKLAKAVEAAGKMLDAFCVHEDSHQSAAYEAMCAALAETERESHD